MGILANTAFSRKLLIRFSEAYSERAFPYAMEYMEEKLMYIIRTAMNLRVENMKFTLDSIQNRANETVIDASHILGFGMTIKLRKKSEYETDVQVIVCDKNLHRKVILEKILIDNLVESLKH